MLLIYLILSIVILDSYHHRFPVKANDIISNISSKNSNKPKPKINEENDGNLLSRINTMLRIVISLLLSNVLSEFLIIKLFHLLEIK